MKRILILIISNLIFSYIDAQYAGPFKTTFTSPDTLKQPFRAFFMSQIPNITVFSVNRYIKKSDFAYINWRSVYNNFMFTSLWDNDMFGTNLLAHPFHGSLDYSGARVSGMNYWQCFPYTFGASFAWEFILENEPMSFNDQISTSFGGQILGEATYRISSSIIDESKTGFERVVREFFGALTCPMNGINRLVTGQMWKWRPHRLTASVDTFPILFGADFSMRHLTRIMHPRRSNWSPYLHGWYVYGTPFCEDNCRPLDYFRFDFSLDLSAKSSVLSALNVVALLWGKPIETQVPNRSMMWGIFQHYMYKEKEGMGQDSVPAMRYAEPASVGLGFAMKQKYPNTGSEIFGSVHLNAVFLAAAQATHFNLKGRHYNFGQGYSTRFYYSHNFRNILHFGLESSFLHFFTWKGYDKHLRIEAQNFRKLNALGDKGHTTISILRPYLHWNFTKHLSLNFNCIWFMQHNHNCQFPHFTYNYLETDFGIQYKY